MALDVLKQFIPGVLEHGIVTDATFTLSGTVTLSGTTTISGTFGVTAAATSVAFDINAAALTTGKALDISNLDAITTGKAIHVDATGTTHTTGKLVHLDSAGTAITGAGRIFHSDHTGATTTSGVLNEFSSAANDESVILRVSASDALAAGVALDLDLAAMTTGKAIDISNLDAITTGKAIHVDATGTTHTTGILVHLDSAATAITTTGRIFLSDHTGATSTSGVLNEFKSAANDETVIVKVTASDALAGGVMLDLSGAALTTGKVIDISDLDAITTGKAIHVDATGVTHTTGVLVHLDSAATAITGAGRIFLSDHTGATTTSGILNEFASAANDESVIVKVTASAALAAGVALDVSAAAMTTGIALDISDLDALTTGTGVKLYSNSADTGSRVLLDIKNDHASANGVTPLKITQDAATSTNFFKALTIGSFTIWYGNENTPNGALSGTKGDILLNGSATGQAFWCTGTTNWTALA